MQLNIEQPPFAEATLNTTNFVEYMQRDLDIKNAVINLLRITKKPENITEEEIKEIMYEWTDWKTIIENITAQTTIKFYAHTANTTTDEPQYENQTINEDNIELQKISPKQNYVIIKNDLINNTTHNAIQHFKNNIIQTTGDENK